MRPIYIWAGLALFALGTIGALIARFLELRSGERTSAAAAKALGEMVIHDAYLSTLAGCAQHGQITHLGAWLAAHREQHATERAKA